MRANEPPPSHTPFAPNTANTPFATNTPGIPGRPESPAPAPAPDPAPKPADQQAGPRMQAQARQVEEDFMQVDVAGVTENTRKVNDDDNDNAGRARGTKRNRPQAGLSEDGNTSGDSSEESTEPNLTHGPRGKKARTTASTTAPLPAPHGWQQRVNARFTPHDLSSLVRHFGPGGDPEAGLQLLFGPPAQRPAGQFCIRPICSVSLSQPIKDLLANCGALSLGHSFDEGGLFLHAEGFDAARFKQGLLDLQRAETPDDNGHRFTALMFAVQWGEPDIVRDLLASGARAGVRNKDGETALHLAAWAGHAEILELLCAHLATVHALQVEGQGIAPALPGTLDTLDTYGRAALGMAAGRGHYRACKLLLDKGASVELDDDNSDDENASKVQQPLFCAAENGHAAVCALLLQHDASVDTRNTSGETPLILAASHGHLAVCTLLVEHGADMGVESNYGWTPLADAVYGESEQVVRYLLEQGAAPNQQNSDGKTALMEACRQGSANLVELLLKRGADPNLSNKKGKSALLLSSSAPTIELLIRYGADLRSNNQGFTALTRAFEKGWLDIVPVLLQHQVPGDPLALGLKPAATPLLAWDFKSASPPQHSASQMLAILQRHGMPLHHVNARGEDALMLAVRAGNLEWVKALLGHGMRIGQANKKGQNALQMALSVLEVHLSGEEENPDTEAVFAALLAQMHRQDNGLALRKDALRKVRFPVARDMLLASWIWVNPGHGSSGLNTPVNHALYLQSLDALDRHLTNIRSADPASRKQLEQDLAWCGYTQPVLDLMMPYLDALATSPALREKLWGTDDMPQPGLISATLQGMFAALEPNLAMQPWANYGQWSITQATRDALSPVSHQLLKTLVVNNAEQEGMLLGAAFGTLYERCQFLAPQPWLPGKTMPAVPPPAGAIRSYLKQEGVYDVVATQIEAAWHEAWMAMVAATSAGVQAASSSASSTSNTPDAAGLAGAAGRNGAPTDAQWRAAFHRALKARLDAPGSGILPLPGAAPTRTDAGADTMTNTTTTAPQPDPGLADAQSVYAVLVQRQLTLLRLAIRSSEGLDAEDAKRRM